MDLTIRGPKGVRSYRDLPKLSLLPAQDNPLLVFLGVEDAGTKAVFLVDAKLSGPRAGRHLHAVARRSARPWRWRPARSTSWSTTRARPGPSESSRSARPRSPRRPRRRARPRSGVPGRPPQPWATSPSRGSSRP